MIQVTIEKTAEGLVLRTADDFKDVLAGPACDVGDLRQLAVELELEILEPVKRKQKQKTCTVGSVPDGTLFRIDDRWYRRICHIQGNKKALVEVVGGKCNDDLPISTEITQISVLSLK